MTSPCEHTTWFITLGCVQWSVTFPAFPIKIEGAIKKLEQNEAESRKIKTVTLFGVVLQHPLFRIPLLVPDHPISAPIKFFEVFAGQKLQRHN